MYLKTDMRRSRAGFKRLLPYPRDIVSIRDLGSMKRLVLVGGLLCFLVLGCVAAYFFWFRLPPRATVWIADYNWYGYLEDDWTNATKFFDFPVVGNYSSQNVTVIRNKLTLMEELDVDSVLESWWGPGINDSYGKFIDDATKLVFQTATEMGIKLKLCIMVEPYLNGNVSYDYPMLCDYVYDNYCVPYPEIYYEVGGKPLICFFNDPAHFPGLTPNGTVPADSRFTTILVGDQNYTQWTYNDLPRWLASDYEPHANQISVVPRYDDRGTRSPGWSYDVDLSGGVYDAMWQDAIRLWREGKIDTILITSWNEYPERTAIEPHYDSTSPDIDPYFLYNKTKAYISQVHP